MDKSKKSEQKNILNNVNNNNKKNKIFENKYEREVIDENIIELELYNNVKENEINILCDKNKLIEDNKRNEDYYKKIILIHRKNLIILIKIIQNYI